MRKIKVLAVAFGAFFMAAASAAGPVSGQGTWETTLHARDINGDSVVDAYYDSSLNITWLADWSANRFHSWGAQVTFAANLNVYGVTGWRLPSTTDSGSFGCDFSYAGGTDCGFNVDTNSSEMAHLYYVTLGNLALCPPGNGTCSVAQPGYGLSNTANFINMQSDFYWSGLEAAPNSDNAWFFNTANGSQSLLSKPANMYAVAVRSGDVLDVQAVPAPLMLGLMMAAFGALALMRRRPVLAL